MSAMLTGIKFSRNQSTLFAEGDNLSNFFLKWCWISKGSRHVSRIYCFQFFEVRLQKKFEIYISQIVS